VPVLQLGFTIANTAIVLAVTAFLLSGIQIRMSILSLLLLLTDRIAVLVLLSPTLFLGILIVRLIIPTNHAGLSVIFQTVIGKKGKQN
jgi:hypothetical protein